MSQLTLEKIKQHDPNCRITQNLVSLWNSKIDFKATSSFSLPMLLSLTNNTISLTDQFYLLFNYKITVANNPVTFQPGALSHNLFTSFGFQQSSYPNLQINSTSPQIIGQLYNINKLMNSNLWNINRTAIIDDDLFISDIYPTIQGGSSSDAAGAVVANYTPMMLKQNYGRTFEVGEHNVIYGVQLKHLVPQLSPTFKYGYGLCQFNISCAVDRAKVLQWRNPAQDWDNDVTELSLIRVDLIYTSIIMSTPPPVDFFNTPVKKSVNIILGQLPSNQPVRVLTGQDFSQTISSNNLQLTSQRLRMIYIIPFISSFTPANAAPTITSPRYYNIDGSHLTTTLIPSTHESSMFLGLPACLYITNASCIIGGSQLFPTNNTLKYENRSYFADWINYYFSIVAHEDRSSDGGVDNKCVLDYSAWQRFKFLAFNVSSATGNFANQAQVRFDVNNMGAVGAADAGVQMQVDTNYILVSIVEITNTL